jgi:hypothetical protein
MAERQHTTRRELRRYISLSVRRRRYCAAGICPGGAAAVIQHYHPSALAQRQPFKTNTRRCAMANQERARGLAWKSREKRRAEKLRRNQFNFVARGTRCYYFLSARRLCGFSRMQKRSQPFFLLAARELHHRAEKFCIASIHQERAPGFVSN